MCRLVAFVLCIVACLVSAQTRCKIDLALLVDGSGSIRDDVEPESQGIANWNNVKEFLRDFVGKLDVSDASAQISLVTFGSSSEVIFNLTRYKDATRIDESIRDLKYLGGETSTDTALIDARTKVFVDGQDRAEAPNAAVILTDGNPTRESATISERNAIISEDRVRILAVGVTAQANEEFMRDRLVTNSQTDYVGVTDFASLNSNLLINNLVQSVCPPEQCPIDLAFAIDSSGSIGTDNWALVRDFAAEIIRSLDVGTGTQAQVAVITYGNEATEHTRLNSNLNETQLLNLVRTLPWKNENTNTTGALRHIEQNIFQPSAGDRFSAQNVIILFTDGKNTREEDRLRNQANSLKNDGTLIITVGVTENIDDNELRIIASNERNILRADEFSDLDSLIVNAVTQACGGAAPVQDPTPPTTTPTTTTTRRPESGCPALGDTMAFAAYSMHTTAMQMSLNDKLMFDQTEENRGGLYSTSNFEFTCTCTGLYRFAFTASHVDQGFVFAIFVDNQQKQPVAYANPNGHVATETITTCNRGQRVSVRVVRLSDQRTLGCTFEGDSTLGFTGYMLVPYR